MITLGIMLGIPALILFSACICMIVGGLSGLAVVLDIVIGLSAFCLLLKIIFDHILW